MDTLTKEKPLKIALIGSLPPPIGGTSVSFKHLVTYLEGNEEVQVLVEDTSGIRGAGLKAFLGLPTLLGRIVKAAYGADVVTLHICTSSLPSFGLLVLCICRIFRKPFIVRKFGGTDYLKRGYFARKLSHFVTMRADIYLAQTKQLVRAAQDAGIAHVKWYPTSRPMPSKHDWREQSTKPCRRFVYLGQVRSVKGINEIIQAGERFAGNKEIEVDVYGTLDFDIGEDTFSGLKKVRYLGVLKPDNVALALCNYDALLLPSYHPGEGYPGVVLEAYGAGLPVICSSWQALPEIVDQTTGILVEPKNAEELYRAMKQMIEDEEGYARLKNGVVKKREYFSTEYWGGAFIDLCKSALDAKIDKSAFPNSMT